MSKTQNEFPLSLFESVKNPIAVDTEMINYDQFVIVMRDFASERRQSKSDAPLISATHFKNDKRSKCNATTSGLIILDIDEGMTIDTALNTAKEFEIACIVYSTASHKPEHHKFRVCIPLIEPIPYDQHRTTWHAVNSIFTNGGSDKSKVGCESLFYVPGIYPDSPTVFEENEGIVLCSEEWIELAAELDPEFNPEAKKSASTNYKKHRPTVRAASTRVYSSTASPDDLDYYETRLLSEPALDKYNSSVGNWHHARFGLMMSIASRAERMGISLSSDDIVCLFNQVDELDGGHYQTSNYQKEIANDAQKVLCQLSEVTS